MEVMPALLSRARVARRGTETRKEGEGRIGFRNAAGGVCHPANALFRAPVSPPWALPLHGRSDYARPRDGLEPDEVSACIGTREDEHPCHFARASSKFAQDALHLCNAE
jgi:hypothetical protein